MPSIIEWKYFSRKHLEINCLCSVPHTTLLTCHRCTQGRCAAHVRNTAHSQCHEREHTPWSCRITEAISVICVCFKCVFWLTWQHLSRWHHFCKSKSFTITIKNVFALSAELVSVIPICWDQMKYYCWKLKRTGGKKKFCIQILQNIKWWLPSTLTPFFFFFLDKFNYFWL